MQAINTNIETLTKQFLETRDATEQICQSLETEDYVVQPVDFVSPPKWHLAHTTWFFEEFLLTEYLEGYQVFHKDFSYIFNSYYNNVGDKVLRPNRGLMTRPTVDHVMEYRAYVTNSIKRLLSQNINDDVINLLMVGINHEQQHTELLAYDIKYILGNQALFPRYKSIHQQPKVTEPMSWIGIEEGVYEIGYDGDDFHFDNERERHKVYIHQAQIASRLVTKGEYLEFIEAGGYDDFNHWHSDGWTWRNENEISAPMYWHQEADGWYEYTPDGLLKVQLDEPVSHISFYEAYAYAEWKEMRLPTEAEWEVAVGKFKWGKLWEWTASAYLPYPRYKKAPGALGEYNGKFMVNQHVLRGASYATSPGHSRPTYRNFFHPQMRWMFAGIRLAR